MSRFRNANDAIALAQTMEGGLDEITSMLQRIRTLAVQAANGINTSDDRKAIGQEARALSEEITRIADKTTYGGKTILGGYNATDSIFGKEVSGTSTDTNIKPTEAKGSITFQVGANSGDVISLEVGKFQLSNLIARTQSDTSAANTKAFSNAATDSNGDNTWYFNLSTSAETATLAIDAVDKVLAEVDAQSSTLGSIQNRLESTIRVQSNVATNESDARSRIRDTDFAEESANLSQQSIIQQAATSMLMQANARPQIGLSLQG